MFGRLIPVLGNSRLLNNSRHLWRSSLSLLWHGGQLLGSLLQLLGQAINLGLSFFEGLLERLTAAKRGSAGAGADAHAILGNAVEFDEALLTQHLNGVGEHLLEFLEVIDPEVGKSVIVDGDAASQPTVGIVVLAQLGEAASTDGAIEG